jgi:hypothetical protein
VKTHRSQHQSVVYLKTSLLNLTLPSPPLTTLVPLLPRSLTLHDPSLIAHFPFHPRSLPFCRTLMERRRSSPPPEASDLDTHRLRECNRVLILELKDTRNRLVQEKRKTAMLAGSMQQQQQLEASAIGMSPGAVREASQPRHDSTPSSRYSFSKGPTSQQYRSPLSQVDVNRS